MHRARACVRMCVCVHVLECHADFSKTTTARDFLSCRPSVASVNTSA